MRRVRGSESGPERWARARALTAQGEGGLGPGAAARTAPAPRSSPKSSSWPGSARRLRAAAPALGRGPGDQDPAGAAGEREGGDIRPREGQGCDVRGGVRPGGGVHHARGSAGGREPGRPGRTGLVRRGRARPWAGPDSSPPGAASTSASRLPHLPPPP